MITIPQFFENSVTAFSDNIYLLEKPNDQYAGTTYKEVHSQVKCFAAGLMQAGLQKGDRVALLSEGRNRWVISELAILYNGAINVPLSVKLAEPAEIRFRLNHAGVKFVIVSGNQLAKIRAVRPDVPSLEKVIVLDEVPLRAGEVNFESLASEGNNVLAAAPNCVDELMAKVSPADPANICYTSGTTADPKGIVLSHWNYIANVNQAYTLMDIPPSYTTLLILPWDHAFAHTAGIYCMMGKGASLASVKTGKTGVETLRNIPVNIRENRPHLLLSAPALAINFRKNIEKGIREKGKLVVALFNHALRISYAYNGDSCVKGKGLTKLYKPLIGLYDKILFKKVRQGFGGRLEFFIGGAALLDIELQKFFYAIGIPMFQGYGLTEASPIISANSATRHKLGSSGYPVKHMELRICDDNGNDLPVGEKGEIVIRGDNVMQGYWQNPQATSQSIRNGWLYTGDMGYMDSDGFLYVLGRFKSLLIADDGEKYSPEGIEEALVGHSVFIEQCMLYNNQNPYTACLLYPNAEALKDYLKQHNLDPWTPDGQKAALLKLEQELSEYRNHGKFRDMFPPRWLPVAVSVLSEGFTEENQLLNSTMKVIRGRVIERYTQRIDFLFTAAGKEIYNEQNILSMKELLK